MMTVTADEWGSITVRHGDLMLLVMYRDCWLCWYGWGPVGRVPVGSC